ncbi:MAG TPA: hypothetical protein VK674_00045 [Candidatus Limnocylindria bacterium]|nr:hypothetical protein [Candidatus Limnocylindria bacterium]
MTGRGEAIAGHLDMSLEVFPGRPEEHVAWQQDIVQQGMFLALPDGPTAINVYPEVLRLSTAAQIELQSRASAVSEALDGAIQAVVANPAYFRERGIIPSPLAPGGHPNEAEAQQIMESDRTPVVGSAIGFGRLDMFPVEATDGSLTFRAIEANMRCVEAAGYSSVVQRESALQYGVSPGVLPPTAIDMMMSVARDAHIARTGEIAGQEPNIGFVYWPNDAVKSVETPILEDHVRRHDPDAKVWLGRPDRLLSVEGEDGKKDVYLANEENGDPVKIDVVYRNIGLHDFTWQVDGKVTCADVLADLIAHPEAYNCTVVPSARQGWAGYKSFFAMISDPAYEEAFTAQGMDIESLKLARETVGWNRMLSDIEPGVPDAQALVETPHRFVIKHIAGAGGANVILGWSEESIVKGVAMFDGDTEQAKQNPQDAWNWVLEQARIAGGWVAQERVDSVHLEDGRVIDVNPYIVQGKSQGQTLCRAGKSHPINIKQGGGVMPIAWDNTAA